MDSWHILIVDDSPTNIRVLAAFLASSYSNVSFALNAAEAREAIERQRPHIILLDIMMPEVDGITFCTELKKDRQYSDIPIIFLTALTDKETVLKAFGAGGVDFLTKPIYGPELIQRIKSQLRIVELVENLERSNSELNLQILRAMEVQKDLEKYQQELITANVALKEMSSKDPLTGLFNRRRAWEIIDWELTRSLRQKKSASVIMLDIDFFKTVNDKFGHAEGDRILIETANLLKSMVREQDLVARWGGEEFLVFLPDTPLDGARILGQKLIEKAREWPWQLKDRVVTFSAGLVADVVKQNVEDKINKADEEMYKAKNGGRDRLQG